MIIVRTYRWTDHTKVPAYSDALPDGPFVIFQPRDESDPASVDSIAMLDGVHPMAAGQTAQYVCLAQDGHRCAGIGPSPGDLAWEWDGTRWTSHGPCVGPYAVIYDALDVLSVLHAWAPNGPYGQRYVDESGHIVSWMDTYADRARGLYEYTEWDDLAIGQGGKDIGEGAVVRFKADGKLRRFCFGQSRNIRARRSADRQRFAITVLDYAARTVTIWKCSLTDLGALPFVTAPMPVPPIPPQPPVPPVPPTPPAPPKPPIPPKPPTPKPPPDPEPWPFPPASPYEDFMTPKPVALRLGVYFARIDPAEIGKAPWPGWFRLHFDRLDTTDPNCHFELSQPESSGKYKATHKPSGALLTIDATEFGGNVCQQFYGSPADAGWGGYQQLSGWRLGASGPEVVMVEYDGDRAGQVSACLTVVEL